MARISPTPCLSGCQGFILTKIKATSFFSALDLSSVHERLEGVNILSHFCNPSGIQQAALWTKAALEKAGLHTSCGDAPVPRRTRPVDRRDWLGLEVFPVTILTHAATLILDRLRAERFVGARKCLSNRLLGLGVGDRPG